MLNRPAPRTVYPEHVREEAPKLEQARKRATALALALAAAQSPDDRPHSRAPEVERGERRVPPRAVVALRAPGERWQPWLARQGVRPIRRAVRPRTNIGLLGEITDNDGELVRAFQAMRQAWDVVGGEFAPKSMPAVEFRARGDDSAFGYFPKAGRPGRISFHRRGRVRDLGKPERLAESSDALLTLLHEWAHTQQPEKKGLIRERGYEGSAEAYGQAQAPLVSAALGRLYEMAPPAYPEWTRNTVNRRGIDWILRGQFG
jgi:hypothetical protein